jgi:hypothetical protein
MRCCNDWPRSTRAAKLVELRVSLGLSEEEIATDLRVSTRTVKLDWSAATWLKAEISLDHAGERLNRS